MFKKIFSLFIGIGLLLITPVYADKEYKFTLDKDLENKQIIYEWENHIDNFSFQMISPSNQIYSLDNYDLIDYNESSNKVTISFTSLQSGQWKVLFKGDSNPTGLNNQIIDYYPVTPTPVAETEIVDNGNSSEQESNDIIIIGAENSENTDSEIIDTDIQKEIVPEETTEISEEEEQKLLKEKEDLSLKREQERLEALNSKKEQKIEEEKIKEEKELEAQREESEILLEFEESDTETVEETTEAEEQVIILGTDENTSPTVVNVEKSESDINMVNINADEERAKIESQIQAENNKVLVNNIIMVTPLCISVFLFLINLVTKNKKKK